MELLAGSLGQVSTYVVTPLLVDVLTKKMF